MPLGATPSRWCVCQFHHFRASNCFVVSYLPVQLVRGSCSCTGFRTDSTLPPIPQRQLLARQFRELGKELLNRIGLRVNITRGRLNAIVTGYVLQRQRVGAAGGLGEKSVSQSVQTSVRADLDPGPQRPHLGLQHPGSHPAGRISSCWMGAVW
jgi:hypothetical protein